MHTKLSLTTNCICFPHNSFQCRDTFYIESFHVVVLIYAPKRIHFGDDTYEMRVSLAILDWVSFVIVVLLYFLHFTYSIINCMAVYLEPWVSHLAGLKHLNVLFKLYSQCCKYAEAFSHQFYTHCTFELQYMHMHPCMTVLTSFCAMIDQFSGPYIVVLTAKFQILLF